MVATEHRGYTTMRSLCARARGTARARDQATTDAAAARQAADEAAAAWDKAMTELDACAT
jgi:hypothetical protein